MFLPRVWRGVGLFFALCGFLIGRGLEWDYFDMGAVTEWQRGITQMGYFALCFLCLGISDILKRVKTGG